MNKRNISTERYAMYGQMEDQANGVADIEAFVFRNGEVIPASEAEECTNPVIRTAPEKNYAGKRLGGAGYGLLVSEG